MLRDLPDRAGAPGQLLTRTRTYAPADQFVVLVADASPESIQVVVDQCANISVRVLACCDSRELLFAAGRVHPDLIMVSASLPEAPVATAIHTIRAHDDVPIVVGVGAGETELVGPALLAGATELAWCPYTNVGLRKIVKRYLPDIEHRKLAVSHIDVGELSLDSRGYELHVAGEPVALPAREFEVLRLLMSHVGEVISFPEIRDSVWGVRGEDVTPQTVAVHIYRLRAHLGEHAHILTVRGVGYRLVE